jgi:phosphate uptake regulator
MGTEIHNEVRKIQYTGRSTYILSLPKKWISELQLKPGDSVTIARQINNSLSITPTLLNGIHTTEVIAYVKDKGKNTIKRKAISMYLRGFSIINFKTKGERIDPLQRDAIREVVRRNLVGTEIITDSSNIITIQVLLTVSELSVNTAIRRMFLIGSSMHKDVMIALRENNRDLASDVIKSDDEVDRFGLYILRNLFIASQNERVLHEIGLKSPADCLSFSAIVKSLERIADHATKIAQNVLEINDKLPEEIYLRIEEMSKLSLQLLNDAVEAFLRKNYYLADSIVEKSEEVRRIESEIISIIDNDTEYHKFGGNIKLILEHLRRTAEHSFDIAESAMNQTVTEITEVL